MEAGSWLRSIVFAVAVGLCFVLAAPSTSAGNHRTRNFIVQAPSAELAIAVGNAAEKFRHDLAMYWLGSQLPAWPQPCPIRVIAGPNLAAQGVTTYNPRPVSDFQMEVVGTPQRILDSVLPHEVTHTVLATYFGRPLPRWADEGICTTVEHASERNKHEAKLREFLGSRRGIAMNQLFLMTEYPSDVLPMYAQGYSVCRFLIDQQGPRTFIKFLKDYMHRPSWTANVHKHYGYESLLELQNNWLAWVKSGSGDVTKFAKLKSREQTTLALASAGSSKSSYSKSRAELSQAGSAQTPVDRLAALPDSASSATNDWQPNDGGSSLRPQAGSALAALGNGWYHRRRQQQAAQESLGAVAQPAVHEPIMPPSVRDSGTYSAAQPQAEQQWSRGGSSPVFGGGSRWR